MAFVDDIADDFDVFDGVEDVTYLRRSLTGEVLASYTVKALKRATVGASQPVGPDGAQMVGAGTPWEIKGAGENSLPFKPRKADRIVSVASGTWEVGDADVMTFATRYVCRATHVAAP